MSLLTLRLVKFILARPPTPFFVGSLIMPLSPSAIISTDAYRVPLHVSFVYRD
jgi:hypothetical protein